MRVFLFLLAALAAISCCTAFAPQQQKRTFQAARVVPGATAWCVKKHKQPSVVLHMSDPEKKQPPADTEKASGTYYDDEVRKSGASLIGDDDASAGKQSSKRAHLSRGAN